MALFLTALSVHTSPKLAYKSRYPLFTLMYNYTYRPDIDGLRAIAVLSVLIHHLNASILPGGFIGVDVFFVISGYLITSQIYKEVNNGTFSVKQFYKRRINRIVPALLLVIAVTLSIGILMLSPADMVRVSRSAVYSILGLSNVYFWREYGNYFAGNASEAPLLHTWSLGVEEQFYIIWPLLLIGIIRLSRRYISVVLMALTVCAIVVSEFAVGYVASASYYLLPTRFFELMMGGLLSFLVISRPPSTAYQAGLGLVGGLALIVASLFWLDKSSNFPGVNAVWPCLGAALVIWAGNVHSPFSRILTNRPMVFIGLISYSLYLWHWPIIAFINYMNIPIGLIVGINVFAASIFLAWLSWKFLEIPMRRTGANLSFLRVGIQRFAIPVLALVSITVVTAYMQGFSGRFDPRVAAFELAVAAKPDVLRNGCHVPTAMYHLQPDDKCRLGVAKPDKDGILIGDSFANHFTGMVDVMAKAEGISLMDYTLDGCPPILGYDNGKAPAYVERCRKRNVAAYAIVAASRYSRVVLGASWPKEAKAGEQLTASIDRLLKTGARVTVILSNESIERASTCPIRQVMYGNSQACDGYRRGAPEYFSEIKARFPMVHFIDPNRVICSAQKCSPTMEGILLYRDNVHLNDIGSRLIGKSLVRMGETL
jgi:peptidoglycan/LPS O-acetylase OafA/YrhL